MNNIPIPQWISDMVNSYNCTSCNYPMTDKHIIAIGLRKSHSKKNNIVLFLMHNCTNCGAQLSLEIMDCDVEEFISIISGLDPASQLFSNIRDNNSIHKDKDTVNNTDIIPERKRITSNKSNKSKSKITQSEVDEFKKVLDNIHTENDLLKCFGIISKLNRDGS